MNESGFFFSTKYFAHESYYSTQRRTTIDRDYQQQVWTLRQGQCQGLKPDIDNETHLKRLSKQRAGEYESNTPPPIHYYSSSSFLRIILVILLSFAKSGWITMKSELIFKERTNAVWRQHSAQQHPSPVQSRTHSSSATPARSRLLFRL